jgi:integrase/recombinase XerD
MNSLAVQNQTLATTLDIENLIAEWLNYERNANGASANTLAAYQRGLAIFRAWLDGLGLEQVQPVDVVRFKTELSEKHSPQTVNLYLTSVRSFYRFCVSQGHALINPASEVKGVKRSRSKVHKRDSLTNSEVINVLGQPDTGPFAGLRDKAILLLLAHCALRAVEIHRANIGDLRTRGDRLTLDIQGKGRIEKDEYVIIPIQQEPVIREYYTRRIALGDSGLDAPLFVSLSNRSKNERMALRSIRDMVKRYYGEAGVIGAKKTTHSLRHSAITNAIRKGASPMQVQAMARHQSFDTTLNYFHEASRLDNPAEDLISYD